MGFLGGRVRMVVSFLVVAVVMTAMVERVGSQMMMTDGSILPLDLCDFHFQGHDSVPPIFNIPNPGHNALSSRIISSFALHSLVTGDCCLVEASRSWYSKNASENGQALKWAMTANKCEFPGGGDVQEEMAELCAMHFHMRLDKLATRAVENVTEWYMKSLKGRHVVLPLRAVDLLDGTQLRIGDGNDLFPEIRRCLAFFTASDITTLLDRVLNKSHRKRLAKITASAAKVRDDLNSLLNSVLQFL